MENPGSYSIGRQLRWLAAVIFIGAGAFLIGRHPPQFHLTSASGSSSIPTIFLTIDTRKFSVPVDRDGSGGGLASHGDELVVLTHEGGLYVIDDDQVRKTEIAAPENGYDAYLKFADDNPQLTFAHYWFRYNDILYIDRPEGGLLVASFTEWSESGDCYANAVATLPTPAGAGSLMDISADADAWTVVFRTTPCLGPKTTFRALEGHMAGGRITHLGGARIALASGDYGWDGNYHDIAVAQDDDYQYGKVLEIDLATGAGKQLSKGHSNAQGIFFDNEGRLWSTEHGRRGGDELNLIVEGGDYGWPSESYGTRYNSLPLPGIVDYGHHDQYRRPYFAWVPSVAISALTQIEGFDPAWDGDLLAGSLKGQTLYRLHVRDKSLIYAEPIPLGQRIRHVHQHTDGRIAVWTDRHEVIVLTVGEGDYVYSYATRTIENSDLASADKEALVVALDRCIECHNLGPIASDTAPALGGVFDRRIGESEFENYSDALQSKGGRWTVENLALYIRDPEAFAPGTSMPDPGVQDENIQLLLARLLQQIAVAPE